LKSPYQGTYAPFDNREVQNNSPAYFLLPGKIQAEDFSYNKGFQTETCTDTGGGLDLGFANPGDYADYDVYVDSKGLYKFDYRIASNVTGKFEMRLVEGENVTTLHSINVTATGGWQTWKNLSAEANLKQGKNKLRFYAVSGEFNLNWISVSTITGNEIIKSDNSLIAFYDKFENSIKILNKGYLGTKCTISCFDMNGCRLVNQQIVLNNNSSFDIQGISLQKGIYLIRIETTINIYVQKMRVL
jgi:hypothetical protein